MSESDQGGDDHGGGVPPGDAADAADAESAPAGEPGSAPAEAPPPPEAAGREISAKLELMGAVALLSVTAAVRMLEMKGRQLGPEQRGELAEVRRKLRTSMAALDEQAAAGSLPGIDLSGLRDKVAQALATLDRSAALLEDPPS